MKPIARMMLMNNSHPSREDRRWDERRDERDRRREYPEDRRRLSYEDGRYRPRNDGRYTHRSDMEYDDEEMGGWYPGSRESSKNRHSSDEYPRVGDMKHRRKHEGGDGQMESVEPLDKETAEEWAQHMQNEDGTTGPHWTLEQTKQVQSQKGIDCEPLEFWLALNATYSDLSKVFKKHGIANIDAYVDFALAFWINDKDAVDNKLAMYYTYIVKH